jgi:hypothetical protein
MKSKLKTTHGDKIWVSEDSKIHRERGPAFISKTTKEWYKYGKRNRKDGPAFEAIDGVHLWFLNDELLDPVVTINDPILKAKYPKLIDSMVVYLIHNS